jgi:hypothetical protein
MRNDIRGREELKLEEEIGLSNQIIDGRSICHPYCADSWFDPQKGENRMRRLIILVIAGLMSVAGVWAGTTGKIAGTVTDAKTGEPILGANVVVAGTSFGSATDENGQYTILYVPPGNYSINVSVIG